MNTGTDSHTDTSLSEIGRVIDQDESVVMTVTEERLDISKRVVESGRAIRLRKLVHEEVVTVDEPLTTEVTEVERVAVDRPVDEAVAVRYEGDVMIVPVVEERLVTRKQLVLVEEIRVTTRKLPRSAPSETTLRREEIIVERLDPDSGEWRRVDPSADGASPSPQGPATA
jgi:uncharacterized protein (TIGR02271 family)